MNDQSAPGAKATPEKTTRRLQEIRQWMDDYAALAKEEFGATVEFIPSAAEKLNSVYWRTLEEKVRPYLEHEIDHNVDRHKIASLIELCVMLVLPVHHDVPETRRTLNAQFAITVAKMVLAQWGGPRAVDKELFMKMTASFNEEHKKWLEMADIEHYPVFSNAGTWYAMEQLCYWGGEKWAKRNPETHPD